MCSSSLQAGLFSTVTSTQVQPQLQPDPNMETAVLINQPDNSTFGGKVSPSNARESMAESICSYRHAGICRPPEPAPTTEARWPRKLALRICHGVIAIDLMSQGAFFFLGCALSLYLRGVNTTIASAAFGVFFYTFIIIAGTAFVRCPYQTPLARILRHFFHLSHPPEPASLSCIFHRKRLRNCHGGHLLLA